MPPVFAQIQLKKQLQLACKQEKALLLKIDLNDIATIITVIVLHFIFYLNISALCICLGSVLHATCHGHLSPLQQISGGF